MSYIKILKNGEIQPKIKKNRQITEYDSFMAKKRPNATPENKNLVFCYPKNLFEASKIVSEVRALKGVLFNLNKLGLVEQQRVLDYLSGASFALDAKIETISKNQYLFIPKGIEISSFDLYSL